MRKLKKAVVVLSDHYRKLPFPEFIAFLWTSLFNSERILIYCKSLHESEVADQTINSPLIEKGDLAELERFRKGLKHPPWEFQCDRYDGVKDFFLDRKNGLIRHISWLYLKEDPNRILRLRERECEIKFCLTLPEYRGKGIYPAALGAIQRYVITQGYQRCFVCAKDSNFSSIRGIEKAGFHLVGRMHVRKAFGLQISRRRDTRHLIKMGSV